MKVNINELVDVVKDQFMDSDNIKMDESTKFKEVGDFDSLTGMCIIVALKDNYGVDVDEAKFREFKTVKDIHEFIEIQ